MKLRSMMNSRIPFSLMVSDMKSPCHVRYYMHHCLTIMTSLKRLVGLLKRLRQNPEILHQYDAVIREQIQRGIVESVGTQTGTHNLVHYLPHHAVLREDKATTKLRIVYDASSRTCGSSLNDCLYTGPKSGQKIMDVLLRFRTHRIAMAADIEKAFLMVSVRKEDRDVLRFLNKLH